MRKANEILETIHLVVGSAAALQTAIHDVALECLAHAEAHGDVTLIDRLVKELEAKATGQRTATLREWVTAFSPIRWSTKDDKPAMLNKEAKQYTPFDLKGADLEPYYNRGKETRPRELSLEVMRKVLLRLSTQVEKARNGEGKVIIKEGENIDEMAHLARQAALLAHSSTETMAPPANEDKESMIIELTEADKVPALA